jgi:hypothetical protein
MLILAIAILGGCSSSEQEQAGPEPLTPQEVASLPRVDGVPLGHIKPVPRDKRTTQGAAIRSTSKQTRENTSQAAPREQPPASPKSTRVTASRPRASTNAPTSSDFSRAIAKRPHVRWVLDGEELTELDPPELLDSFRLDFDETRRLSFDDLPYAFMTENSQEAVIRRGDVIEGHFEDLRISPEEKIVMIFYCTNPNCPRREEVYKSAKFPFNPSSGQLPECPYCGSEDAEGERTGSYRFKTMQAVRMEELIRRQFYRDRARKQQGQ